MNAVIEITKENKEALSDIRFIIRASGNVPHRKVFQYIHITESFIEATDGHRLHRCVNAQHYEPGLYRTIVNRKTYVFLLRIEEPIIYPNTERKDIIIPYKPDFSITGKSLYGSLTRIQQSIAKEHGLNADYLYQAGQAAYGVHYVDIHWAIHTYLHNHKKGRPIMG